MRKYKMQHRKGKKSLTRETRMMFVVALATSLLLGFMIWISL